MRFGERSRSGTKITEWTKRPSSTVAYGVATSGSSSTITDGGYSWTLHSFTATGTLTITKEGLFEVLIIGGGGGGGSGVGYHGEGGGGGSAGQVLQCVTYLTVGSCTCTIGGGGSQAQGGNIYMATNSAMSMGKLEAAGGVSGGSSWAGANRAYNGSGASYRSGYGGSGGGVAMGVYGFNGGSSSGQGDNGGGGGAGGAGGTRTRGAGLTLTFTGSSITWGEGGLGGGTSGSLGAPPAANSGGGGSGAISTGSTHDGASGAVYVRHR